MKNYHFTIITSTFNCGEELLDTAESIKSQNRDDIQWIIIDGFSCDSTQKIINNCSDLIDIFISEKDNGIYDAWNKAISYIKGEWVLFLGAGDTLYSGNTINEFDRIQKINNLKYKLIYGKIRLIDNTGIFLKSIGQDWSKMKDKWQNGRRMLPVHPEVFHHYSLFKDFEFDNSFKIAGDSDFLIRVIISGIEPYFINQTITNMVIGGTSQAPKKYKLAKYEIDKLNNKNYIKVPFIVRFSFKIKLFLKYLLWLIVKDNGYLKIRKYFKK